MSTTALKFPIFALSTRANPQAVYEQMRLHDPIYRDTGPMTGNTFWFLTNYDDVQAVLKDARFIKDAKKNLPPAVAKKYLPDVENPIFDVVNRHMLNLDAPDHTRLRGLVHKAFTPRMIQDLQPRIEQIATDLLNEMATRHSADLINDFAYPLPITVIGEMLGIGSENREKFREWTHYLIFGASEEEGQKSVMEFVQFINVLIEERQVSPKNDILSGLVNAEEAGDKLDRMELLSMVFLLLVAGHETTVNLIGNGTLALLQHPDQLALLRANPALINTAVEEILRYNGPVETPTTRFAREDVAIGDKVIRQGDIVLPSLLGANRDPKVFENPNVFDITRNPNPHVAFGFGVHFCLGAPLARMEGTLALNALVQRFPHLALDTRVENLQWNDSLLIHGMLKLPVKY